MTYISMRSRIYKLLVKSAEMNNAQLLIFFAKYNNSILFLIVDK